MAMLAGWLARWLGEWVWAGVGASLPSAENRSTAMAQVDAQPKADGGVL